jgi:hypothetical protein
MIQPRAAGCYTTTTQFLRELREAMRQRASIRDINGTAAMSKGPRMAIVSYDEKPGIQAIAPTAPDLPPEPGVHTSLSSLQTVLRAA